MALSVPLSRFTSRVGGGSAFFVRRREHDFGRNTTNKTEHIMNTTQKSKSMALVIPALIIQMSCLAASHIAGVTHELSLTLSAGSLVGLILLIVGLRQYAKAKGYGDVYGLLGLLSLVGVVVLAVLPDKHSAA